MIQGLSDLQQHIPISSIGKDYNASTGKLTVNVIEGHLLRDTEIFGKMTPLVVIECNGVKFKTKSHKEGGKLPKWNESFEISVHSMDDVVKIRCEDEELITNDLVGETSIRMEKLCARMGFKGLLPIEFKHAKAGHIHIETKYTPESHMNH